MKKTVFKVPKMDCPSEEKLIRMALVDVSGVDHLDFDLMGRKLTAYHESDSGSILRKLEPLNFGAVLESDSELNELEENLMLGEKAKAAGQEKGEIRVLTILLALNGIMFLVEIVWGLLSQSTGLISDSMDMFADSAVYGISLYAVGKAVSMQKKAARMSGYAQVALALFALVEVTRRSIFGSEPEPGYMVVVSLVALVVNVFCLVLIMKHRSGGVHMKASAIFSANDVIANLGVILAGVLVSWTGSRVPDLVIGFIIALIVLRGAIAILKISSETPDLESVV
jgi:Co/Zn/Cd efflux system component